MRSFASYTVPILLCFLSLPFFPTGSLATDPTTGGSTASSTAHRQLGLSRHANFRSHAGRKFPAAPMGEPPKSNLTSGLEITLPKRATGVRFSRFKPGLGACGAVNTDSDFIVALTQLQWDGGSHCFAPITVRYKGKVAQAKIVDRCEICPYNGLDLSNGLFAFFEDPDIGIISGDWDYGSGAGSSAAPAPATTTHKSTATQASTQTSTSQTTQTSQASSSAPISQTIKANSTSTTMGSISSPTGNATSVLSQLNSAWINMGGMLLQSVIVNEG